MPSDRPEHDPLEPVLRDVEAELRSRLRDACEAEANGISTENAAEIRRLEDSLLAAAVAAEQTIALRRHIDRRKAKAAAQLSEAAEVPNEAAEPAPGVREFRDAEGRPWRAWPVTPGQARPGGTVGPYLGEFNKGWICFEALEGSARRRLPGQPPGWTQLEEHELRQLLGQAINAPERKRSSNEAAEPSRRPAY